MTDDELAAIEARLTPSKPRKFLDQADYDAERVAEADADIVRLVAEVKRLWAAFERGDVLTVRASLPSPPDAPRT